jgi:thiol-disulfide isomerase/thioredoxin
MRTVLLLCLVLATAVAADPVAVGSKAPPLGKPTWIKGEPVELGKGRVVVECWATWCQPCLASIPHLTKLQKAHPEVAIAGITAEDADTVKPFVEKQGADMDYHVGLVDDGTWNTYMEGIQGPPHAYVLDADSTVLWEGHPMALDGVLDELKAGTFDPAKAKQVSALERQLDELAAGMSEENHEQIMGKMLGITDQALKLDPFCDQAVHFRLQSAQHLGDHAAFRDTFSRMPIERLGMDRANGYAWKLATLDSLPDRNLDIALAFAKRAVELDPKSSSCAETLGRVYYDLALIDQAIAQQQHAIELDPKDADLPVTLKYYQDVKAIAAKP